MSDKPTPMLNVVGKDINRLKLAMQLVEKKTAAGYVLDEGRIVFFEHVSDTAIAFPTKLSLDLCADIAWEWLQAIEYPEEPDTDGSTAKGWRLYTDFRGTVEPYNWASFVAVEPRWFEYGK